MTSDPGAFPWKGERPFPEKADGAPRKAPAIFLENLSFTYAEKEVFRNLEFTVEGGLWTCLIGESGCGKSTLLKMISGTLGRGLTGSIRFDGFSGQEGLTAWMAQKDLLLPWLSVLENVCLGARLRGELTEEKRREAITLLDDAGLAGYAGALPSRLSGGMRQRVALLRTLMERRPVVLMDEPFSALDALTRLRLQDLASNLVRGKTVLMVTHDPLEALRLGHRIYAMQGRPARLSRPVIPPGEPPRRVGDPEIAPLQEVLLGLLQGEAPA